MAKLSWAIATPYTPGVFQAPCRKSFPCAPTNPTHTGHHARDLRGLYQTPRAFLQPWKVGRIPERRFDRFGNVNVLHEGKQHGPRQTFKFSAQRHPTEARLYLGTDSLKPRFKKLLPDAQTAHGGLQSIALPFFFSCTCWLLSPCPFGACLVCLGSYFRHARVHMLVSFNSQTWAKSSTLFCLHVFVARCLLKALRSIQSKRANLTHAKPVASNPYDIGWSHSTSERPVTVLKSDRGNHVHERIRAMRCLELEEAVNPKAPATDGRGFPKRFRLRS